MLETLIAITIHLISDGAIQIVAKDRERNATSEEDLVESISWVHGIVFLGSEEQVLQARIERAAMEEAPDSPPRVRGKRLSKATRSRSNTMTSTSSSFESPASSTSSNGVSSRNTSQEIHESPPHIEHQSEQQSSTAKSLLSRGGRMLKRQTSKFGLLTLNEERPEDGSRPHDDSFEKRMKYRSKSVSSKSACLVLTSKLY